ncbi:hypothetical protein [Roseibium sediminis]|uniref:hypothetical protein n=1 Tax=Roseibium sediminis TaxID=1775174 RepID=UPI00123C7ABC|nr:hypothetical protein [Roseibium sediminis]
MTVSDIDILAAFTMARAVLVDPSRDGGLQPWLLARRIGIRTEQVHALFDGVAERIGSTARAKLLAFNDLTEAELAGRPAFVVPDADAAGQNIADRFAACRLPKDRGAA